jgi:hypothetical protein
MTDKGPWLAQMNRIHSARTGNGDRGLIPNLLLGQKKLATCIVSPTGKALSMILRSNILVFLIPAFEYVCSREELYRQTGIGMTFTFLQDRKPSAPGIHT